MTTLTITKEQEKAIQRFKENGDTINSLIKGKRFALEEYRPLRSLALEDFADIVQNNRKYEVINNTYKPGDHVYHLVAQRVLQVNKRSFDNNLLIANDKYFGYALTKDVRPATLQEILEWDKWNSFGRFVNHFKYGDVLELTSAEIVSVCDAGSDELAARYIKIETAQRLYNKGKVVKIYPVERIVEFKEVDL